MSILSVFDYLKKPEYYLQPSRIWKRFTAADTNNWTTAWGGAIQVINNDAVSEAIVRTGIHELAVAEVLYRLSRGAKICVDAGANIGLFSQLMARNKNAAQSIYAFEPNPEIVSILRQNISYSDNPTSIHLFPLALGYMPGHAIMEFTAGYANNKGMGKTKISGSPVVGQSFEVTTLDTQFKENYIDLLKLDLEGAEYEAILGATKLLQNNQILNIVFEDFDVYPSKLAMLLLKYGFEITQIKKGWLGPLLTSPIKTLKNTRWESVNYLATRNTPLIRNVFSKTGYFCLLK